MAAFVCTFPWGQNCDSWCENSGSGVAGLVADSAAGAGPRAGYTSGQPLGAGPGAGFTDRQLCRSFGWPVECRSSVVGARQQSCGSGAADFCLVARVPDAPDLVCRSIAGRAREPAISARRRQQQRAGQPAGAETAAVHRGGRDQDRQRVVQRYRAAQGLADGGAVDAQGLADRLGARRPRGFERRVVWPVATQWRLAFDLAGRYQPAISR